MRFDYQARGKERKRLAYEVGFYMHMVPVYQMLPTKSYMVGEIEITLDGVVVIPEGMECGGLLRHLAERGFSGQESQPENLMTIIRPREGFDQAAIDRLRQIVRNKAQLFGKAFGNPELEVLVREDQLRFPWFKPTKDEDELTAYSVFITRLCELAGKQRRVRDKASESDNDRYAFRCFLLRLGLIGSEHARTREILMGGLPGNSAFRHPEQEKMIKRAGGAR